MEANIRRGRNMAQSDCLINSSPQHNHTKALKQRSRFLTPMKYQRKAVVNGWRESRMENVDYRNAVDLEGHADNISCTSLSNNGKRRCVSASIDFVAPRWVLLNNVTQPSDPPRGASRSTPSCASVPPSNNDALRNHLEGCRGGDSRPDSQQSKSLVMTHDGVKRSGSLLSNISSSSLLFGLIFIVTSLIHSSHEQSIFSPTSDEWDGGSFRSGTYGTGYTCINIPVNFTLCKNIGYTKMMIPNLLGHDSLQEAEFHVSLIIFFIYYWKLRFVQPLFAQCGILIPQLYAFLHLFFIFEKVCLLVLQEIVSTPISIRIWLFQYF